MIIELVVIFVLQVSFPYIAISAIGSALQMFFLYFNIENPDFILAGDTIEIPSFEKLNIY